MALPGRHCACSPPAGARRTPSLNVRKDHNSRHAPRPDLRHNAPERHRPPVMGQGSSSREKEEEEEVVAEAGCGGVPQKASSIQKLITVSARPSTDYPGNIYRVEATIEQPPEKVFPFLYLPEYRTKWDKSLQSYKLVDRIDQDTAIYHSVTHSYGFGLVPPRDFVYILHIKKYNNLLTTNSISVDYPKCPVCSSYIRGQTYPSSYACYPSPENPDHCRILAIVQVDLGGMLLPSVVESVMPASLMTLITDCRAGIKKLK
ncbi:PREDICTED: stAR-related lipid transfer protein 6 [Gekko japonicus]|uniref:StAR-related lipid transfer protein 6 n=1 Tax=Gekko japonicus TaxID=146911 RepID=A0ABM1KB60_GEKJA|nr:PREDICTED: stAR-related lipid transfer protein 6 [Gekko japonicus]